MSNLTALQSAALMMLLPKMEIINCTTTMFAFKKAYGVLIDHHEFSAELDQLATRGLLLRTGTDNTGRALYQLNRSESGPALDAIEAGHLNRVAEHAANTGDRSADTEGACDYCGGSGEYEPGKTCSDCDGTGLVDMPQDVGPQHFPPPPRVTVTPLFTECEIHELEMDAGSDCPECLRLEADAHLEAEANGGLVYEPDEFPDGEFPSPLRWRDPDWGTS